MLAALIVTYNRSNELQKTINSIKGQGISECDIFVVNNNSLDNTKEILIKYFPKINAINLENNIASAGGFCKGMQIIFQKGYDWMWLFNDDSRPLDGTLNTMMKYILQRKILNIGMFQVAGLNDLGQAILLYWNGRRVPVYVPVKDELIKTDLVTFDGTLISSELVEIIGFCDPEYFMGTYEFDFCLRATDSGFNIYTLTTGSIEDKKMGSTNGLPPWRQYYNTRNHLWLGIHRKSFKICYEWFIQELKNTCIILLFKDKKLLRIIFKIRAIRDAIFDRRGKRYDPINYKD